jgi:hypothetical protein
MTRRWLLGVVVLFVLPLGLRAGDGDLEKATSKEGKFLVLLPKNPETQSSNVATALGDIKITTLSGQIKEVFYAAAYADYPAEAVKNADTDKLLDGARDGAVSNVNGKLMKETKLTLGDAKYPGREILVQGPDGKFWARQRMYLVGNRLYQTIVVGSETDVKSKTSDSFFKSFGLTE